MVEMLETLGDTFIILMVLAFFFHQLPTMRRFGAPVFSWVLLMLAAGDCLSFAIAGFLKRNYLEGVGELCGAMIAGWLTLYTLRWERKQLRGC